MKEVFGCLIIYGLVFWFIPAVICVTNDDQKYRDAVVGMHLFVASLIVAIIALGALVYLLAWCFS